jgi:hypothetical protein
MVEEMMLERVLEPFSIVTGRTLTEEGSGGFPRVEGSPDFVMGFDGHALGIELAEVRSIDESVDFYGEALRLALKKDESYARRNLFVNPIVLILYSNGPPLFEIEEELMAIGAAMDFEQVGFAEVWAVDFSGAYFSDFDPRRPADLFCFKPRTTFGFHRIGHHDRKPFG